MGIYNTDDMQIVFSDTPGVLKPNYKLQESMLNFSTSALTDADILLYVTDVIETPDKNNEFIEKVRKMTVPVLLLINKIDLTDQEKLIQLVEEWKALLPHIHPVSLLFSLVFPPLRARPIPMPRLRPPAHGAIIA